jgi:acyl carrier protein
MSNVQEWMADMLMCTPETLPPAHTRLNEIEGWDSLRHVSLILGLERALNQKLTAEQIQGMTTLGDVAGMLGQKVVDE